MTQPDRRLHLYFGVRDEDHVYDEGPLQVLVSRHGNLRVDTVLSEPAGDTGRRRGTLRSEEHTSELQSLMRISYAVFCLKKKTTTTTTTSITKNKDITKNRTPHT